MSPEHLFHRWLKISIGVFVILFAYFLLADIYMPATTESTVRRYVVQVAPRVSGQVTQVLVHNNQHVEKGDLLFQIDPLDYQLSVQQAELHLQQVTQQVSQLQAELDSAQASLDKARINFANDLRDVQRYQALVNKGSIPVKDRDDAVFKQRAASAEVTASEAKVKSIEAELGIENGESILLKQAKNSLATATLALERTQVKAESAGFITDLQLEEGAMASANQPVVALVSDSSPWVTADFREKSLIKVSSGTPAKIVFDALPGTVFDAEVSHRDYGVASAQGSPDGKLASAETSTRWVRDAQRVRVNLELKEAFPANLVVGSRATVQLIPSDNVLFSFLANSQIRLISWLHYIY
ncbi:hypothetical protein WH50_07465 [Pokkaliibacter plantistimulans]|uniref:Multidrug resistance protein MdtA-like barrel-sandwich hybrid domain-containing protein n=1 Tax=Pokkaliibacter plantistimulans TaxID=1635171 RepID=A0ABX5LZ27_9GAMM|nr:HlyD family secretion protein [Pokkaliibacter plantistimulans]PXF31931.1 hypothetical protein WH50_07465 [Pokkaliibacter plantistimulans]